MGPDGSLHFLHAGFVEAVHELAAAQDDTVPAFHSEPVAIYG